MLGWGEAVLLQCCPITWMLPPWPSHNIYWNLLLLYGSCVLIQWPLHLNYEKAANSIWGGQKAFILPGFTGLTLSGPPKSLTVNNSITGIKSGQCEHLLLIFVTVHCPHSQCTMKFHVSLLRKWKWPILLRTTNIPAHYQVITFPFTGMTAGHNVGFHGTNWRSQEKQCLNLLQ